jgi:hypothetical protein
MYVTDRLSAETFYIPQKKITTLMSKQQQSVPPGATVWVEQVPDRNQTTYTSYNKLNANCIKIGK